jgi:hypothetical protein
VRTLLFVLLVSTACTKVERDEPAEAPATSIRSMDLRANGEGGTIHFDTGKLRGTIEIGKGLLIGYKNVTQTGGAEPLSKTVLTIDGRELVIEPTQLRVGDHVIGPLSGDVKVEIKKDGVFVDGAKKSEL